MATVQNEREKKFSDLVTAVGLAAGGMLLGFVTLIFLGSALGASGVRLSQSLSIFLSLLALQGVGLVGMAFFYLSTTDKEFSYVKLRKPSAKHVAVGFGSVFVMLAAVVVLSLILQSLGQSAAEHGTVEQIEQNPSIALYMVPLSILVIGPSEELLFRGVIQTKLRESFSGTGAVGVASVIFALIHIPAYGSDVIADIIQQGGVTVENLQSLSVTLSILFALALVLGYIYEKTDNLTVPMITHGFYNAVLFGLVYIGTQYADELDEAALLFF
ncbi:MAG: type II CAAX endopeptidase family protein [Halobacteriales archaeon]|nr:type II CAAX endopeptidase family protein [Halobacteriales archaeon]